MLKEVERIVKGIIEEWDVLRRKYGDDGDSDNKAISKKQRKAQELFNATLQEMKVPANKDFIKKGGKVEEWVRELAEEAQFNVPSYTECFISENLLRKYVEHTNTVLSEVAIKEAGKWKEKENQNKQAANISYDIRKTKDDIYYLDMSYLANLIDKVKDGSNKVAGLSRSAFVYKPVRDAVGHTSLITDNAKKQLNLEYENIKARVAQLLEEVDKNE